MTIVVEGVGAFSPQLYRRYETNERTWIVPRGIMRPLLVKLVGRGAGDTYISRVEAFRREKPVSSFVTGRFLPAPNLWREGRLFEIERYVVNKDAFSAELDGDGDGRWSLCRLSREENTPYFSRGTVLKSDSVAADRSTPAEGCQPLHVRVGPLEPGRYQVHFNVPGRALGYSDDGQTWRRLTGTKLPELGLMMLTGPYFEFWLDDRYAEAGNPGPTYVDYIRFMPIEDPAYTMAPAPAPQPPQQGRVDAKSIALTIENPTPQRRREPVRSGVPIPKGHLADAEHARVLDDQGRPVPSCVQVTGRWPDGSVKWLLLDMETHVPGSGSRKLTLEYGNRVAAVRPSPGIRCERGGLELCVNTGASRVRFDTARGGNFTVVYPDRDASLLKLEEIELQGSDGRVWRSSLDRDAQVEVEEQNALRATVRLRGRLKDAKGAGPLAFDTRVHLFAGRAEVLIELGVFATEAEATVAIAQAKLVFIGPWTDAIAQFAPEQAKQVSCAASLKPRLLQTGGQVHGCGDACPFTVRDGSGRVLAKGDRAVGVLGLRTDQCAALFCVPYFWQQFPKAIACSENRVEVELWAGETPFIAHAGAGKSHRVGISLDADASSDRWLRPLFARAVPEWYCASGAFEELVPRRRRIHEPYEELVDAAFDMQLEERAGYGMENWGDVWQPGYVRGAKTWSNQEWDLVNNWVIPFVRTGQRRYLDFAHEAARHYADVDCIHYSTNPALLGGAWMHAHTSLEGHQLERPNFAHAGWVEGMLNIYHLTGDRRGLEAAKGIASYICRHAPATDRLSPRGPAYNLMIQRPAGWPLTTLCLVYRETWDPALLQTARRIVDYARRCQDPERGAWDAQVGHERPYRGGCVFAYTLLRGLRLFADITGEDRARQDYVNAARWIMCELWRPRHRYLYEQCPLHEPGARVPFILSEMAGYATRLSGDPVFATIGHDAFLMHTAAGKDSPLTSRATRSQWGNGILQQVPRMLWDWQRTGLRTDEQMTLAAAVRVAKVPIQSPGTVKLLLRNGTDAALDSVRATCMARGDWWASVSHCPQRVPARGTAEIRLSCQAPPPVAQYERQNDLVFVHVLVRARHAGKGIAAWGHARLEIAEPLEVGAPPSVALKRGCRATVELAATDGVDPDPKLAASVSRGLKGLVCGRPEITATGPGAAAIVIPLSVERNAPLAAGELGVAVQSGPRRAEACVPAEIGRFRVALIESDASTEWQHPFRVLRRYPGIAVEFVPTSRLRSTVPNTAADLAAKWEAVVLAETGEGASAFAADQLSALAAFVEQGGGLMTVAGMRCYTPGGYADTPLARVLPVDLSDGAYALGSAGVEVTEPKARFFEGYDPAFPRFGAHQRLSAKPGARVIARFDNGAPFATLGTAGKGRVLCLGAIWNHGSGKAFRQWPHYGRFIGRCVRWVARDLD